MTSPKVWRGTGTRSLSEARSALTTMAGSIVNLIKTIPTATYPQLPFHKIKVEQQQQFFFIQGMLSIKLLTSNLDIS